MIDVKVIFVCFHHVSHNTDNIFFISENKLPGTTSCCGGIKLGVVAVNVYST
jgi:hypothetical protein